MIISLSKALEKNETLQILDIFGNTISYNGALQLCSSLKQGALALQKLSAGFQIAVHSIFTFQTIGKFIEGGIVLIGDLLSKKKTITSAKLEGEES